MPTERLRPDDAELFRALGDANRLKILRLLRERVYCVHMIAEKVGLSQPAASQHLRVLRTAGLVHGEKRGFYVHYSLRPEAVHQCAELVTALAPAKPKRKRCGVRKTTRRARIKA